MPGEGNILYVMEYGCGVSVVQIWVNNRSDIIARFGNLIQFGYHLLIQVDPREHLKQTLWVCFFDFFMGVKMHFQILIMSKFNGQLQDSGKEASLSENDEDITEATSGDKSSPEKDKKTWTSIQLKEILSIFSKIMKKREEVCKMRL